MEDNKLQYAKAIYNRLLEALDDMELKYNSYENKKTITCNFESYDLPISICFVVEPDLEIVNAFSRLPFVVPKQRRDIMSEVVNKVNLFLLNQGNVVYDYDEGILVFKQSVCYKGSLIGKDLFTKMLASLYSIVDLLNDKLSLFANKNDMTVDEFMQLVLGE